MTSLHPSQTPLWFGGPFLAFHPGGKAGGSAPRVLIFGLIVEIGLVTVDWVELDGARLDGECVELDWVGAGKSNRPKRSSMMIAVDRG